MIGQLQPIDSFRDRILIVEKVRQLQTPLSEDAQVFVEELERRGLSPEDNNSLRSFFHAHAGGKSERQLFASEEEFQNQFNLKFWFEVLSQTDKDQLPDVIATIGPSSGVHSQPSAFFPQDSGVTIDPDRDLFKPGESQSLPPKSPQFTQPQLLLLRKTEIRLRAWDPAPFLPSYAKVERMRRPTFISGLGCVLNFAGHVSMPRLSDESYSRTLDRAEFLTDFRSSCLKVFKNAATQR